MPPTPAVGIGSVEEDPRDLPAQRRAERDRLMAALEAVRLAAGCWSTWRALGRSALDSLGQHPMPILPDIGAGPGQIQVALVLEGLGGGPVADPVLLQLVQVLGALEHHDCGG